MTSQSEAPLPRPNLSNPKSHDSVDPCSNHEGSVLWGVVCAKCFLEHGYGCSEVLNGTSAALQIYRSLRVCPLRGILKRKSGSWVENPLPNKGETWLFCELSFGIRMLGLGKAMVVTEELDLPPGAKGFAERVLPSNLALAFSFLSAHPLQWVHMS